MPEKTGFSAYQTSAWEFAVDRSKQRIGTTNLITKIFKAFLNKSKIKLKTRNIKDKTCLTNMKNSYLYPKDLKNILIIILYILTFTFNEFIDSIFLKYYFNILIWEKETIMAHINGKMNNKQKKSDKCWRRISSVH